MILLFNGIADGIANRIANGIANSKANGVENSIFNSEAKCIAIGNNLALILFSPMSCMSLFLISDSD